MDNVGSLFQIFSIQTIKYSKEFRVKKFTLVGIRVFPLRLGAKLVCEEEEIDLRRFDSLSSYVER